MLTCVIVSPPSLLLSPSPTLSLTSLSPPSLPPSICTRGGLLRQHLSAGDD
jgi:hypothetical protein